MPPVEPYAISISEAARLSGIGRSSIYQAIRRGELPIRKLGTTLPDLDGRPSTLAFQAAHRRGAP